MILGVVVVWWLSYLMRNIKVNHEILANSGHLERA